MPPDKGSLTGHHLGRASLIQITLRPGDRLNPVHKKVTYGLENALNYSHDDFHEDRHGSTIRLH